MIQSASYLVCFGKRERDKKRWKKKREKKVKKKSEEKKRKKKKSVREKREFFLDISRFNLVVEFGLESVLCTVQ